MDYHQIASNHNTQDEKVNSLNEDMSCNGLKIKSDKNDDLKLKNDQNDDGNDDLIINEGHFEMFNDEELKLSEQIDEVRTDKKIRQIEERLQAEVVENLPESNDVTDESIGEEEVKEIITKLGNDFGGWVKLRKETISSLRGIAEYIDSITYKSSMVKAVGSGSGVLAGSLTLAGGILTILSAGAALPILLVGTGIGLAAGVAGGTAAITEKVMKSRQMGAAKIALEADHAMTQTLETSVELLRKNKRLVAQVTKHVIVSGGSAVSDSFKIAQLVASKSGVASTIEASIKATAQLLGEDVGKEVSKILLHTSGRVLSGAVTVVFGGATIIYDIYRLSNEVQTIASKGKDGANDIRTIANELETSLEEFLNEDVTNENESIGEKIEESLQKDIETKL